MECAPKRLRIGPASRTVTTVDATSSPAARAASPPARPVSATEATSVGATPAASTPPRNAGPLTRWLASHANAGRATVLTVSTSTSRREAVLSEPMSLNVIDAPVQNTRTARVARMAFAPSRRRPGLGNAIPRTAASTTRGRRNCSSAAAILVSSSSLLDGPSTYRTSLPPGPRPDRVCTIPDDLARSHTGRPDQRPGRQYGALTLPGAEHDVDV